MGESTQHLRQALPAFVEDYQLQEALARCEVILSASEAARIEKAPATTRFVGNKLIMFLDFRLTGSEQRQAWLAFVSPLTC